MATALELRNHALFSGIDADALARHLAQTVVSLRKFESGTVLMLQGERLDGVTFIREGRLSATIETPSGRSLLVETLVAPEILAPAMLFAEHAYLPVTLTAVQDGSTITISMDAFRRLAGNFPRIYERILREISEKFEFITTKMRFLHFETLREKLAGYLLERRGIAGSTRVILPYDRARLAELFGVARPSLSRTIGELVNEGIILTSGKAVDILDAGALERARSGNER